MAPNAQKVPEEAWNRHKDRIAYLVKNHSKPQVLDILRQEHGFDVTLSQLESKLKLWDIRKNLSQAEWNMVLDKLDHVKATGRQGRVMISGRPIEGHRVERARRHCGNRGRVSRNKSSRGPERFNLTQVHIDILAEDGRWEKYTDFQHGDVPRSPDIPLGVEQDSATSAQVSDLDGLALNHHGMDVEYGMLEGVGLSSAPDMVDHADLSTDWITGTADFGNSTGNFSRASIPNNYQPIGMPSLGFDERQPTVLSQLPLGPVQVAAGASQFDTQAFQRGFPAFQGNQSVSPPVESGHIWALSVPAAEPIQAIDPDPLPLRGSQWLQNLPFRQLERDLKAKGIDLSEPWLMTRQIGQMQLARSDQMQTFMRGLQTEQERISSRNVKIDKFNLISESRKLKSFFRSLLLGPAGIENTRSHEGALISEEEVLNTHFNRILISSLVNGCAGLQDVPIESVLKHLMRYRHTSSILLEFLRNSRTHMAKALSESLFIAAIEAGGAVALKTILQIPTIDANKTLCFSRQDSCAIEAILYAAYLGNLDAVRVLRKAGAVVDKSRPRSRGNASLFAELLFRYEPAPDIEDDCALILIAKELLLAGLEVTFEDLESSSSSHSNWGSHGKNDLPESCRDEFLFFLASQCVQNSHSRLITVSTGYHGPLYYFADVVADGHATRIMSEVIRICKQEHGGLCLWSNAEEISMILRTAARQGKLQLVQLLLPYSKQLHLTFTAAIGSRNVDVIEAVLAYGPDIDAPAHLGDEFMGRKCENVTSFSEAVRCGNDRIIQMILDHGYMDRLEHGSRFHPAVTAAAQANDLGLLRSLLDRHDNPHPAELGPALLKAFKYGNDEAARMLLESGASTSQWNANTENALEGPLCDALKSRNRDMTYALLDASHTASDMTVNIFPLEGLNNRYEVILREAAKWGDQGIITAIFTTFPWIVLEDEELAETLQNNDLATFNFLLASQRVRPSALDQALNYAVRKEDEKMIGTLISLGANPFAWEVLAAAVDASLPTMNIVLSQKSTPRRPTAPGNGNEALQRAMERGAHGVEVIERLLQSDDIGLCTVSLFENHSTEKLFAPMGMGIQLCCWDDDDDMQILKLFLKAGHSPDYIVQSECIIDEEFPEDLRNAFSLSSQRYYLSNMTAVLLAIELRSTKLVKLLLDHGANVNLPARFRILRTPLQKACEVGSLEIVKLLLDRGADPNGEPARCQGATALQLAAISGNCRVAAELLDRGADLYQPPLKAGGHWPLVGAAKYGRLEMIEFLWKVSITGFDKRLCDLAMKLAERWGNLACRDLIKDLMEHGPASGIESMKDLLDFS